jgi:hypothetical protein
MILRLSIGESTQYPRLKRSPLGQSMSTTLSNTTEKDVSTSSPSSPSSLASARDLRSLQVRPPPGFQGSATASAAAHFNGENFCLFEDHVYNSNTKRWETAPESMGSRRCLHSKCRRKHKVPNRPVKVCPREEDCPDAGITCFLLHDNTKIVPLCNWGVGCADSECRFYRHPPGRTVELCPSAEKCPDALISCFKLHPLSKLVRVCHYKVNCVNFMCVKRHPPGRRELCPDGPACWNHITRPGSCDRLHPSIMFKACRWDLEAGGCLAYGCTFTHHPASPSDCPLGAGCPNRFEGEGERCRNKHPRV